MGKVVSMEEHKVRKKRKLKKLKRRRAGSVRWVMTVLVLMACVVAGYSLSQSSIFLIDNIQVSGNENLATEKVIELSGITKGQHIYEANLSRAQLMIGTNYWVDSVKVKRVLPNTVKIAIKERQAVAAVTTPNGIVVIDSKGYVLKTQKLMDGLPLMILSGVSDVSGKVLPGHQLESDKVAAGLAVIMQMSEEAASVIAEFNMSNTQNIIAHTIYGFDLYLGDKNDFLEKFGVAKEIIQAEDNKGNLNKLAYIDISIPTQPTLSYLGSGQQAPKKE